MQFWKLQFPLTRFRFDRFDTDDHERHGKWSTSFLTNAQGEVDKVAISLDQSEVTFQRKPEVLEDQLLHKLAGTYLTPSEARTYVMDGDSLFKEAGISVAIHQESEINSYNLPMPAHLPLKAQAFFPINRSISR